MGYELFLRLFEASMSEMFSRFGYLLDSDAVSDRQRRTIQSVIDGTDDDVTLSGCVKELCCALESHHGRKAVVLIDEYDRAVTDVFGTGLQRSILGFLGAFMSSTLKGNDSLQLAYVTGVMQVAKAGMFSGVNNLRVNDIFSSMSDERFGFTETEVRDIMEYYGRPDLFDEVRSWYDGYRFGDTEMYNPFSVMSYVSSGFEARGYWANSGTNAPIRWMLERTDRDSASIVSRLISGGSVATAVHTSMTYEDMHSSDGRDLLSLMTMTGYLKAVPRGDEEFDVSVPNREVMDMVDMILKRLVKFRSDLFETFCRAVVDGDATPMEECLHEILAGANHYAFRGEHSYELILLTAMRGILRDYDVRSEVPAGNGRADLMLTPVTPGRNPSIVIELKVAESESALDREADAAMEQIRSRRYHNAMTGRVVLLGISFWGVVPRVRAEVERSRIAPADRHRRRCGPVGSHISRRSYHLRLADLVVSSWTVPSVFRSS